MCIIAHCPNPANRPSDETLKTCWTSNPDGAGIMFPNSEHTAVTVLKGLMTFEDFLTAWHAAPTDRPITAHFRIRSHGPLNAEMTHPFYAQEDQSLAFVHNGMLGHALGSTTESDTCEFASMLKTLPADWLAIDLIRELVEHYIGFGNKMVFMDKAGNTVVLNDKQGTWEQGVWYSNHTFRTVRVRPSVSYPRRGRGLGYSYYPDDESNFGDWKPAVTNTADVTRDIAMAMGTPITPARAKTIGGIHSTMPAAGIWSKSVHGFVTISKKGNVSKWVYDNTNLCYNVVHWWKKGEVPKCVMDDIEAKLNDLAIPDFDSVDEVIDFQTIPNL